MINAPAGGQPGGCREPTSSPAALQHTEPPPRRTQLCLTWALFVSGTLLTRPGAAAVTLGGEVAITSDAIYRGMSESFGRPALQADVHATTARGTYFGTLALGTFGTPAGHASKAGAPGELTVYVGQHFGLGDAWNAQLTAYNHHILGGAQKVPEDYQEVVAQLSYLDLWSLTLAAIPDAVRYQPGGSDASGQPGAIEPAGRYAAYVAATQLQWLLTSRLFLTAGAGYYFVQGGRYSYSYTDATGTSSGTARIAGRGYAYGNPGLAYQWGQWRVDVGYFLTWHRADVQIYPFEGLTRRVAATISWRF